MRTILIYFIGVIYMFDFQQGSCLADLFDRISFLLYFLWLLGFAFGILIGILTVKFITGYNSYKSSLKNTDNS